ncbi:hypothetical protein LIER_43362 [Lithospermum erythrorhizon]|uniref:Uncharacterized protein n=1 Tax=Lithospermum erythrorhizon TaxID=34254 RepID=A0AAV3PXS9_LITER
MSIGETTESELQDNDPKDLESHKRGEPHEDLQTIAFEKGNADRFFRIGTKLDKEHREALVTLIKNPSFKPVKQKKRNFSDDKNRAIQKEVEELVATKAISERQFPEWIANVVMVKKSNNKWRMCIDFTSLNKACPKDYYALPCFGRLVYGSAGHEIFDFLDASRISSDPSRRRQLGENHLHN